MRRRDFVYLGAAGVLAGCKKKARPEAVYAVTLQPGRTTVPITYVVDYGEDHLDNPEYLTRLREAPPAWLQVGQDTLFSGLDPLRPDQVRKRKAAIARLTGAAHAAGVEKVIPSIWNQTMVGDPQKRTGFWRFFDHWKDYQEFGVPVRPMSDPLRWMQRDPFGNIQFNDPKSDPSFAPEWRWAPCPNNEYWHRYLEFVAEQIASCGYDGVFVDKNSLHCYCTYCQRAFQRYASKRYTQEAMERALGTGAPEELRLYYGGDKVLWAKSQKDFREFLLRRHKRGELEKRFRVGGLKTLAEINEIGDLYLKRQAAEYIEWAQGKYTSAEKRKRFATEDLRTVGLNTPEQRRLWFETQRFWAWSIAENLLRMGRAGARQKPDFVVVPNWGALGTMADLEEQRTAGKSVAEWKRGAVWMMFEEDGVPGAAASQFPRKLALAQGVRPLVRPADNASRAMVELAHAEATAGGGGAFVQAGYAFPEVRRAYRKLYAKRANLFRDLEPLAEVGLVFLYNQSFGLACALRDALEAEHILWNALAEEDITAARLKRYRVVLVPGGVVMEDGILAALKAHQAAGGAVEWCNEMPAALAGIIEKRAGKPLVWTAGHAELRANVYWRAERGQARIVAHLLNYAATPERDVAVSIPMPGGTGQKLQRLASIASIAPMTGQETALTGGIQNGCLVFRVPEVRAHSIVEAVAVK
jgi:hypothetical protein